MPEKTRHCRVMPLYLALLFLFSRPPGGVHAQELSIKVPAGGVVIFGTPRGSEALTVLTLESMDALRRTFADCGRFMPVENYRLRQVMRAFKEGESPETTYQEMAEALGVDLYVVVAVAQAGSMYSGELRVIPLNPAWSSLERRITVRSRIPLNIPLKMQKEATLLHEGLPLKAAIVDVAGTNLFRVDAGQWHGLGRGKYGTVAHGRVEVLQTGRYESVVRIEKGERSTGSQLVFRQTPPVRGLVDLNERMTSENTIRQYGLDADRPEGGDPRKRFLESMCVINLGGNVCLPVYGSFLSTHYMGFEGSSPDARGLVLSSASLATQLLVPEFLTGFEANFFPWVKDDDKTTEMQNLQIFLWVTIPFTFTVSYLDQLAVLFEEKEKLPPFFDDRDSMAAVLSLVVPGGGLYYKGYRASGWFFYFSEMTAAGYGVYNGTSRIEGRIALLILTGLKCADMLAAWLVEPSYSFYRFETGWGSVRPFFSVGELRRGDTGVSYMLGLTAQF